MDKFDELLKRCFKCKSYQENECGIYFMMALWNKECKFFKSMITYNDFLKGIYNLPSEEEFNKIISALPPIDHLPDDFNYELGYDVLATKLIDVGLLDRYDAYTDDVDLENKQIWIYDFESLEDLEKIKDLFEKYGWTLESYEEEKESLLKAKAEAEIDGKTSPILYKLQHSKTIEEFKKNLKNAYEESLTR